MESQEHETPPSLEGVTWLSSSEASKRLGVTTRTLYRLIDEGLLSGFRFGRVIRLKEKDVDQYAEQSRIQPGDLRHLYQESEMQE
ncbi:MAG: helix-turn-helix domain-containing protein [Actinomycetota bacterium]|jgi:excisionase family DNA binding protein|nr:hypothetical protein [Acidimicrobiaceae bacterium]MEC9034403.1 helix-turn-helix domain-containing protein [Actinomycetota bacterium]MEE2646015.1 helix-turn-helix domain-containing protein [Actinomycetota bacterium]